MFLLAHLALALPCALAAPSCEYLLISHEGEPVSNPAAFETAYHLAPGSRVNRLGEGGWAVVYRVTQKDGKAFELKVFKENDARGMRADVESLKFLAALKDQVKSVKFDVSQVLESEGHWMKLSDTRGLALDQVIADPKVPAKIKKELTRQFNALRDELLTLISNTHDVMIRTVSSDGNAAEIAASAAGLKPMLLEVSQRRGRVLHEISIKASNLVIDPATLKFTLIDPL